MYALLCFQSCVFVRAFWFSSWFSSFIFWQCLISCAWEVYLPMSYFTLYMFSLIIIDNMATDVSESEKNLRWFRSVWLFLYFEGSVLIMSRVEELSICLAVPTSVMPKHIVYKTIMLIVFWPISNFDVPAVMMSRPPWKASSSKWRPALSEKPWSTSPLLRYMVAIDVSKWMVDVSVHEQAFFTLAAVKLLSIFRKGFVY